MKKNNIIKIILFFSIIIIPVITMNIKSNQVSEIDNRNLIELKDIFNDGSITNNIEAYFNDRIGFRTNMVNIYNKSFDILFEELVHPSYEYGKDEFIFYKYENKSIDNSFQEIYSEFIKNFQEYCKSRGIGFLYAVEPRKEDVYGEYIADGFNYSNDNFQYLLKLLSEKNINYINNLDILLKYKNQTLLFDKKYDAGHWNETGAIIGFSAIIDKLNEIDSRIGKLDINNFEIKNVINETLPVSYFKINEETTHYDLKNDSAEIVNLSREDIEIDSQYRNFTYYRNNSNKNAPRILVFAGSYFNGKEKFLTSNFSEVIKVHNYRNVINFDYYINLFNPDIVLFESTNYTHTDHYFPVNGLKDTIYNKPLSLYNNLEKFDFVNVKVDTVIKNNNKVNKISIPIESEDILYSYAYINNRVLDCRVKEYDNNKYVEFSILISELENIDKFDLYFISKNELKYDKKTINIKNN